MTRCAAIGCRNSGGNGFKLHRFLVDKKRRLLWAVKVKRWDENRNLWIPPKRSTHVLCEAHFERSQYEPNRQDKKLKTNAVPTIFEHTKSDITIPKRKPPRKRELDRQHLVEQQPNKMQCVGHDHSYKSPNTIANLDETNILDETKQPDACFDVCQNNDEVPSCKSAPMDKLQSDLLKSWKTVRFLQGRLQRNRKELCKTKNQLLNQTAKLKNMFTVDQCNALARTSTRGLKWSADTIKVGMQIWFACGTNGYKDLCSRNYPLPSVRTLQRRLHNNNFESGILHDVFNCLKEKIKCFNSKQKDCALTLDEINLKSGYDYSIGSGSFVGNVTLPNHDGISTHALVFMLSGLSSRWKQVVAYYFTGNSTDGSVLNGIIREILKIAHDIGLFVRCVTSDMGSMNVAMWRTFGIIAGKYSKTVCSVNHPHHDNHKLYFMADVPHLVKNIRTGVLKHHILQIPSVVATENKLPTTIVNFDYLLKLAEFDETAQLKLARKLTTTVLQPNHFDKMKVSFALIIFSQDVIAGLRYLVQTQQMNRNALTLAWFLETIRKWFDLMSSRTPVLALSLFDKTKHAEAVSFLKSVVQLFTELKVGNNLPWKPWQTGVVLSTTAILEMQNQLLVIEGYKFLLTSRYSQDCLENLFSCVRLRTPVPTPLEFTRILRLISAAQMLRKVANSSYDQAENVFLAEFLDTKIQTETVPNDQAITLLKYVTQENEPSQTERAVLYYLTGYVARKIEQKLTCCTCKTTLKMSEDYQLADQECQLLLLKEYRQGSLFRSSESAFDLILIVERYFRLNVNSVMNASLKNVRKAMLQQLLEISQNIPLPECHDIREKLIQAYLNVKLHDLGRQITQKIKNVPTCNLGSKSLCMRELVNKI